GDTVDCVDIYRQPAMKRIGMENHVIATPPELPGLDEASAVAEEKDVAVPEQSAVENGQVCPEGSVPIRRVTMETMKNFRTLEDFRKKVPSHLEEPRAGASSLHQYAHAYRYVSNLGAETVLNLWSPYVERSNEFSLSQMWVVRGSGADLETVEAGWQEYKDLYGDWRSRLFIYFTPDAYGSGGCYNLTCGAFVQYSSSVYIGGAFSSYSSAGGTQQEITLRWHKGGSNNAWWLRYGNTWVGYYPQNLFDASGLRNQASVIDFGGEIIDRHVGRHTFTDMGSGYFPSSGFGYAAYQRSIKYLTTSGSLADATGLTASRTDSWCYDINLVSSTGSWGVYFFFGGSGYNVNCQ
ncbi:MAG: neprosin family prolyl endopeptidase, partial [Gammaproteobacteria bacterium]